VRLELEGKAAFSEKSIGPWFIAGGDFSIAESMPASLALHPTPLLLQYPIQNQHLKHPPPNLDLPPHPTPPLRNARQIHLQHLPRNLPPAKRIASHQTPTFRLQINTAGVVVPGLARGPADGLVGVEVADYEEEGVEAVGGVGDGGKGGGEGGRVGGPALGEGGGGVWWVG